MILSDFHFKNIQYVRYSYFKISIHFSEENLERKMAQSRNPTHVSLYGGSYVILFDDGSWSSQGLPRKLTKKMNQTRSDIEFVTLGPNEQWFLR